MSNSVDLKDPGVLVKKSVCYFCHNNCGMLVYVKDGKVLKVEGDDDYPVNNGGLCSRGNINHLFLDYPGRVNYPLKRVGERGAGKVGARLLGPGAGRHRGPADPDQGELRRRGAGHRGRHPAHRRLGAAPLHEPVRQPQRVP